VVKSVKWVPPHQHYTMFNNDADAQCVAGLYYGAIVVPVTQ